MKAIEKKVRDDIESALKISEDFVRTYHADTHPNLLTPDFVEKLIFFSNRAFFVAQSTKNSELTQLINKFRIEHCTTHKSHREDFYNPVNVIRSHLKVIEREINEGLIYNMTELMKAEIFDDFLEGAKYLLDDGWKDAAAVIIGGVLENHLRTLCTDNGLPILDLKGKGLAIDQMNISLCKADVYKLYVQKMITPFAGIRNDAAHGDWDNYKQEDVEDMFRFVSKFKTQIE